MRDSNTGLFISSDRIWETFNKVPRNGWDSKYRSIDNALGHYTRKSSSEKTRKQLLHSIMRLCMFCKTYPDKVVKMKSKQVSQRVQSFLDSMKSSDKSIRYINITLAYLLTFFRVNGFKNGKELDIERYHQPSRYRKMQEYIPTAEEILKIAYSSGSRRNIALILAAYTSGLRNATIRSLKYKDVSSELENRMDVIRLPVYPEMKEVHSAACKGMIPYYAFISRESTAALREYIKNDRKGIKNDELLFPSDSHSVPKNRRLKTVMNDHTIGSVIHNGARRAGIQQSKEIHPHCLRKAYEHAMRSSKIDPDDREFLMGHILPRTKDTYYAKDKIDYLRVEYTKVRFFGSGESAVTDVFKRMAEEMGLEVKEEQTIDNTISEIAKVYRAAKEDLEGRISNGKQKVIKEDEVDKYLEQGWEFVSFLPSGKVVIKKTL